MAGGSGRFSAAAAREANRPWVERVGKAGFAAKGVLYLVIAATAASVGLGAGEASQSGAIEQVAEQPWGSVVVALLVVGLAGYAVLRLVQVVVDPSGKDGLMGVAMRASHLVRAVVYGGLCVQAVRVLTGNGGTGGSEEKALTRTVLDWPGGRWLVAGAAVALLVVAAYQLKRAVDRSFMDQVHTTGTPHTLTLWSGTIGHAARSLLFATIALLLARAALRADASESGGLSEAFQQLATTGTGSTLVTVTAVGVAGYGVWCLAMTAWGTARRAD